MRSIELQKKLKEQLDTEIVIRGKFGNTFVNIEGIRVMSNGKILLSEERGPEENEEQETLNSIIEIGDMFLEMKEFIGTEPEIYRGVGIGLEKAGREDKIYVENERHDGMFSMISFQPDEAKWLAEKLIEYAEEVENQKNN